MKFSIIIPIYNKEKYLRRCLDSVVKQTVKDFECLLIDDGSTDRSNGICKEYVQNFDFFKLYKKENGGLSDARNYGIEKSNGDYLLFLDADDCIDKNLIYICEKAFEQYDTDIVAFVMKCVNIVSDLDYENESVKVKDDGDLIFDILCNSVGFSVCNKAYKREVFKNLKFIKGKLFEDQFIMFKLIKGRSIVILENNMYFYFQDIEDSLSKKRLYPETYDYLEAAIEFTKDVEYCEKYFKLAVQTVYDRIVLLLTNLYYNEGQFRECKKEKVDSLVRGNIKLLRRGLPLDKKMLIFLYLHLPKFMSNMIIRMRFKPIVYLKGKAGLKK